MTASLFESNPATCGFGAKRRKRSHASIQDLSYTTPLLKAAPLEWLVSFWSSSRVIAGVVLFFVALGALGSCALVIAFDKLKVLTDQNKKLRARVCNLEEQQKAEVPESIKKKSA
jgi:hypothetical protein